MTLNLNRMSSYWNRDERIKINDNWDKIEESFNGVTQEFDDVVREITQRFDNAVDEVTKKAYDEIIDAVRDLTKINWLAPVPTYDDIETTYPNPILGDITITYDDGSVYRYDGEQWVFINKIDPDVYMQLQVDVAAIQNGLTVTNNILSQLDNKVMVHLADFVSVSQFGEDKNSEIIQAALDYAKYIGGVEILVPSGEYVIYEPLKIPSNTKIRGLGEVIFKRASDVATAIILNDSDGTIGGYDASKNIEIENIIFDSNNTEIEGYVTALGIGHAQNIKIKDCTFLNNTTWHDIEINGCKNVLIDNCHFPNYQGTSEMLQLDAMINEGVFPWFGPADKTSCENVVINRCRFNALNNTVRAIGNHSYDAGVTSKHVIVNNCEFVGFATTISLLDVIDFYVNECKFIDCKTAIAWIQAQNDICNWVFSRNSYRSTVGYIDEARFFYGFTNEPTLKFSNIYFIDNYIDGAPSHGIAFTPTGKVIIKGNHIRNCGKSGIFIYGGNDIIIEGNTLEVNNIRQESERADIVVGNNGNVAVNNAIITNNIAETIINGTNTNGVKIYNNIVKNTLQDNSPSTSDIRGNTVAGVKQTSRKEYTLYTGTLKTGSATLNLPSGFTSLDDFDEIIVTGVLNSEDTATLKYFTETINVKSIIDNWHFSPTAHVVFLGNTAPEIYWIKGHINKANKTVSIQYNRKLSGSYNGVDIDVNYVATVIGVKYY